MKLIWTKSNSIVSILIRFITGDDCSHFAFVFEGPGRTGLMFESNFLGTHPAFLQTSLKTHSIVHEKTLPMSTEQEDMIWDLIIQKYDNKAYDFGGVFYMGYRIALKRLFNVPLPQKNSWASSEKYWCDEVYDIFNSIPGLPKIEVKDGMYTPHDVYKKLEEIEQ